MVQQVEYTIQCKRCGKQKTFKAYPGPTPKFCPECFEKFRRDTTPRPIEHANPIPVRPHRPKPKEASFSFGQKSVPATPAPNANLSLYQSLNSPTQGTAESTHYRIGNFPASRYQEAIFDEVLQGKGDIFVVAAAGSGKSTTMVEAVNLLLRQRSIAPEKMAVLAFNKHIEQELRQRLRGSAVNVSTIHALGFHSLQRHMGKLGETDAGKYRDLATEWLDRATPRSRKMSKKERQIFYETRETLKMLADFARLTQADHRNETALREMAYQYAILQSKQDEWLLEGVGWLLGRGEEAVREQRHFDFTDMLWIPHLWQLPVPQFQFMAVDEAQDLNALQRELVLRMRVAGGRIVWVGDPAQSIMGFAGADTQSFQAIQHKTKAKPMSLMMTYRCPKSHVTLAQEYVPQLEARPNAPEGTIQEIETTPFMEMVTPQDMVIARRTAPLVEMAIQLIANGKPARVRGQDHFIVDLEKLVDQIVRTTRCGFGRFEEAVERFYDGERESFAESDSGGGYLNQLGDKCLAILAIYRSGKADSFESLVVQIQTLFKISTDAITLSTIHRAKGLEAERVFILRYYDMPLMWDGQKDWEYQQELNILYVALTRAKHDLFFVKSDPKPQSPGKTSHAEHTFDTLYG